MKKALVSIFLLAFVVLGQACAPSGGGGDSSNSDAVGLSGNGSIYGTWIYRAPGSGAGIGSGIIATLKEDKTINIYSIRAKIEPNGIDTTVIYRQSYGTFEINGNTISANYSYETCNPIGSESLKVELDKNDSSKLYVEVIAQDAMITMTKPTTSDSDLLVTAIEDKNCDLM